MLSQHLFVPLWACFSLLALPLGFTSGALCSGLPNCGADNPGDSAPACCPHRQPPEELEATMEEPGRAAYPTRVHPP